MHKRRFLFTSSLLTLSIFLCAAVTVKANILEDFINGAKKIISPEPKGELKIDSNISFAKDGDLNKNGEFDAGDFVTFSFKIENSSDQEYPFSSLKTRIPSDSINYIRNIYGVTGVVRGENVIEFPNIYLNNNEVLNISSLDSN